MVMANKERISRSLDLLRDGLAPKCAATWEGFFGSNWLEVVNSRLHSPAQSPNMSDASFLFKGIKGTWSEVFGHGFSPAIRSLVFEVAEVRNKWAHQEVFTGDDTLRALDSMERVLEAFGNVDERRKIRALRHDLLRQVFEETSRAERRKTAAKPTEGHPQAGLTPWREIIAPHADVAAGRFDQAEFAADLFEVLQGTADAEYQDPQEFFDRTYLTQGLRDLLAGAARRLSGGGGDPVIELQTNFGGGKTHSMIALYHLASGVAAQDLPGVGDMLGEAGVSLPDGVARAVLAGQMISPAAPQFVEDGVELRTMWGHLAYQLGGRDGYEMVRTDDEAGTNPGVALRELFELFGPAVVLIDEWVAYARQLRDGDGERRLPGGDFDTQFTFAQALTEAAAAVPNVVVLVTIPASDIEVGGDRGRTALERLKNVVTRTAAQWQPASPDESFEIVRRRLFDPIPPDRAKVRDGVIRAFSEMYRDRAGDFPSGVGEAEYRRRMELSYPIHPALFDRLFGDWSALDKFQRTRGVLRLMALAISQLWQRGDRSLLIMPSNLPMDSGTLVSEMKKYLEEGWDPVIKSDVDGPNSLPLRIDNETPHFGRLSATRRAARTVYMGSAPRPDAKRGVDLKSVVLGCVQPGEPPGQFADALKRLSGEATHLYVDGNQYWYSLQPNVTRMAADRAASNYTDRDADDEVKRRLNRQRDRGNFAAVQVFAEGPGDVPDNDDGVRLVVLTPGPTHSSGEENSPAVAVGGADPDAAGRRAATEPQHAGVRGGSGEPAGELRAATRSYLAWCSIVDDSCVSRSDGTSGEPGADQEVRHLPAGRRPDRRDVHPGADPDAEAGNPRRGLADRQGEHRGRHRRSSESQAGQQRGADRPAGRRAGTHGHRPLRPVVRSGATSRCVDLWQTYARYPYMARLSSFDVLTRAISDGTAKTELGAANLRLRRSVMTASNG